MKVFYAISDYVHRDDAEVKVLGIFPSKELASACIHKHFKTSGYPKWFYPESCSDIISTDSIRLYEDGYAIDTHFYLSIDEGELSNENISSLYNSMRRASFNDIFSKAARKYSLFKSFKRYFS